MKWKLRKQPGGKNTVYCPSEIIKLLAVKLDWANGVKTENPDWKLACTMHFAELTTQWEVLARKDSVRRRETYSVWCFWKAWDCFKMSSRGVRIWLIRLCTGTCFFELTQREMNKRQEAKHEQVMKDTSFGKKECISHSESHKATIKVKYISCALTTYVFMSMFKSAFVDPTRQPQSQDQFALNTCE